MPRSVCSNGIMGFSARAYAAAGRRQRSQLKENYGVSVNAFIRN